MFLKEYFKRRAERKAEEASRKIAEQELLIQRKNYWELSKELYIVIELANNVMDNTLPLEYIPNEFHEWPKLGTWSLKVDDKLTVKIETSCPREVKLVAYEARFFIDNVPIDVDLTADWMPEFRKFRTIVSNELEKKVKEYAGKKKSVVDNYLKWRDCNGY